MAHWLKLVGKADWKVPEHWVLERWVPERWVLERWVLERSDLLHEIRRLIAVMLVTSSEARYDAAKEWEKQWPLVLDVKPVLRVGRVSQGAANERSPVEARPAPPVVRPVD